MYASGHHTYRANLTTSVIWWPRKESSLRLEPLYSQRRVFNAAGGILIGTSLRIKSRPPLSMTAKMAAATIRQAAICLSVVVKSAQKTYTNAI
jgi:hypothetical protein